MKPKALSFEYTNFDIKKDGKTLLFNYRINFLNKKPLNFTETIILPKVVDFAKYPENMIENLMSGLHLMLGISYYKIYCPNKIKFPYLLTKDEADFWNKVYREGLGEFYFRNNLSPKISPVFSYDKKIRKFPSKIFPQNRALVGIGGGKDSILAVELMRETGTKVTGFVVPQTPRTQEIVQNSIAALKIPALNIKREIDPKIHEKFEGSYNGHVPISGIFAFLGLFSAVLYGYRYVVVGNEQSSNFGNTEADGVIINHQWSKSSEFEKLFQDYVRLNITKDVTYFSILRPFHEIRIIKQFCNYPQYFKHFTSCNRNFKQDQCQEELWCGKCPKCLFIYLLFAAFLTKKEMLTIFGRDFLDDKENLPLFKDILGLGGIKPFDCVGTFDEAKVAFEMAQKEFKNSFVVKELSSKVKVSDELKREVFSTAKETNIPDKFRFAGLENALILGYEVEGKATEKYLKKKYPKIQIGIADAKDGKDYLKKQAEYDIVVKTPGIPKEKVIRYHTTATNIFFSEIENFTIGVTATKGKSTTSSLIADILKNAGYRTLLVGNIGQPMLEAVLKGIKNDEFIVVELSSYQLDDIHYSPNIALVLNLYQDHMTYHGDLAKYYEAKRNILKYQTYIDYFIYNPAFKELKNWAKNAKALTLPFGENQAILNISTKLLGRHNLDNMKAAFAVAKLLKVSDDTIYKSIKDFSPLEHRLEFVQEVKGIKFYNDSISTTPESTIAAIKCFENIGTIILGGTDRGYDFGELEKFVRAKGIKNIVLFPKTGERMFTKEKGLNILRTKDMKRAVEFAYHHSKAGEIVLLSPASPSFENFKDYKDRGEQFKNQVAKL